MFGLILPILFTPGVGELLCASPDLDLLYTFCDSTAHDFTFHVTPCSTRNKQTWEANLTWIPRRDVTFLKIIFNVWFEGANVLHWKEVVCSGADDKYSVCGRLKGETFTTAFHIKGARITFPKGSYSIISQGFSDSSETNMFICLNFTMTVKQDAF